jgi:prepilin-type N-terminal cleavage/methylation domain-containing protein
MNVREVKQVGGFTLIELLVSLLLASFIAVTSVGALRAVTTRRDKMEDRTSALAELRFAARQVEQDLRNLFRTADKNQSKLVGTYEEGGGVPSSRLCFYTMNTLPARAGYPEGDLYEVEYFLQVREEESRTAASAPNMVLMRRLQPNPNKTVPEPGGVVSVVAENILLFDVRYYDGTEFLQEWPEEMQSYPSLIMVSLATKPKKREQLIKHNFMMNFVRWPGQESSSVNVGLDGGGGEGSRN